MRAASDHSLMMPRHSPWHPCCGCLRSLNLVSTGWEGLRWRGFALRWGAREGEECFAGAWRTEGTAAWPPARRTFGPLPPSSAQ